MATTDARKKTGAKIGAAGAVVAIVLAGMGGCSYLQSQSEDAGSNTRVTAEEPRPSAEGSRSPSKDPVRESDERLDPNEGEKTDSMSPDPVAGEARERIVINEDGTTSVVRVRHEAVESSEGAAQISPVDVDVPEDRPAEPAEGGRDAAGERGSREAQPVSNVATPSPAAGDDAAGSEARQPSNSDGGNSDGSVAPGDGAGSDRGDTPVNGGDTDNGGGSDNGGPGRGDSRDPGNGTDPGNDNGSTPGNGTDPGADNGSNPGNGSDPGNGADPGNGSNPGNGTDPGNGDGKNPGNGDKDPGDPGNPGNGDGNGKPSPQPEPNPGGGDNTTPPNPDPGNGGDPTNPPVTTPERVNIQALIDYVNFQRNIKDANDDGGILNDGVSTDTEKPSEELYQKNGGALVVVDCNGRPAGVIWSDMSQSERDSLLRNLSSTDQARIYGINQADGKASITIEEYILRDTQARDDSFEVEKGAKLVIKAEDLLANDRVLMDQGGLFGLNKGATNITDVSSDYEGITWNPRTGEVTVDPEKYKGDADELTFTYTIRHDQSTDRNKSRNTSTSTGTVRIKLNRDVVVPETPETPEKPEVPTPPTPPAPPTNPGTPGDTDTPGTPETPGDAETQPQPPSTPGGSSDGSTGDSDPGAPAPAPAPETDPAPAPGDAGSPAPESTDTEESDSPVESGDDSASADRTVLTASNTTTPIPAVPATAAAPVQDASVQAPAETSPASAITEDTTVAPINGSATTGTSTPAVPAPADTASSTTDAQGPAVVAEAAAAPAAAPAVAEDAGALAETSSAPRSTGLVGTGTGESVAQVQPAVTAPVASADQE